MTNLFSNDGCLGVLSGEGSHDTPLGTPVSLRLQVVEALSDNLNVDNETHFGKVSFKKEIMESMCFTISTAIFYIY